MDRFYEFLINEGMHRKKMIRDGKVVVKWVTDKPGVTEIQYDQFGNPHEERIPAEKIKAMKDAARKNKSKREGAMAQREVHKAMSMNKRRHDPDLKHYDKEFPDVNSEHDQSTL